MELDHNILAVVEPALMPTEIKIYAAGEEGGGDKQTKNMGNIEPFIMVNKYTFGRQQVRLVDLNLDGVVPSCIVEVEDTKKGFEVDSYPRDGDVFTLLINSKNQETFKSIHMDFTITNISASKAIEGEGAIIVMSGMCKIPKLFGENCQKLDSASSLDHMELVARELKLGLATNIDATDDTMSRIQAYETYLEFIKSIVQDSYISDDSFQKYYIDQYYYLNYVEVNRIFNSSNPSISELQDSLVSSAVSYGERGSQDGEDPDNAEMPLLLTNLQKLKGLNNYVEEVEIINNSNQISLAAGNKRNVMIYDNNSDSDRLQKFDIEPLTSTNLSDIDEPLKGRRSEEDYLDNVKYKYIGRQNAGEDGLGNVHPNSVFAKLHNKQNELETQKIKVKVTLSSFNPSLYKYQKIPLLMYHYDGGKIRQAEVNKFEQEENGFNDDMLGMKNDNKEEGSPTQMIDRFLTGYYIIENININYDSSIGLTQEVTLIRREWPTKMADLRQP